MLFVVRRMVIPRLTWLSVTLAVACGATAMAPDAVAQAIESPRKVPSYRSYTPGLLARTRAIVDSMPNHRVEIWDLLVGPGRRTESATLPGGGVFEVRAGSGTIAIAGQQRDLRPGSTFEVPEGTAFAIVNGRSDSGLSIRVVLIAVKR